MFFCDFPRDWSPTIFPPPQVPSFNSRRTNVAAEKLLAAGPTFFWWGGYFPFSLPLPDTSRLVPPYSCQDNVRNRPSDSFPLRASPSRFSRFVNPSDACFGTSGYARRFARLRTVSPTLFTPGPRPKPILSPRWTSFFFRFLTQCNAAHREFRVSFSQCPYCSREVLGFF